MKNKKTIIDISPEKTYRWPAGAWKDAQHHWLVEKCKLKLQKGIISHWSEKNLAIIKKSTNNKYWTVCGEKGPFLYSWWECKLVQPLWRTVCRFLTKLKIELPYDSAIPLLGIYPDKTLIQKDTCTPYIHSSTTHNSQDMETKYPLTDGLIKMWYIYTMAYSSVIKKEWNSAICSNMDGPRDYTKLNKSEGQIPCNITLYVDSEIWHKWTYLQNRNRLTDIHRHRDQICGCQGGGREGERWIGNLELVDANYYI